MRARTIIVTGGAGFIGCNLVRELLESTPDRVVVWDALTYAGRRANLRGPEAEYGDRLAFETVNICDGPAVEAGLEQHRPDALLNLAAESHVDRSIDGPIPFVETNVTGTVRLLHAAQRYWEGHSRPDFRFLQVSTDEVYGSIAAPDRFFEHSPYAPNSPYAASKAAADHFVHAFHNTYGLPTLLTNCSNNYGPYQLPEKLIPLMILNAHGGRPLPVYGDGQQIRDWIHVRDHCRGVLAALERGTPGERYNFGGDAERANLDVVQGILAEVAARVPAATNAGLKDAGVSEYRELIKHVTDRPGHDRRYAVDFSKAQSELGWSPQHTFEDGLRETVAWYLDNEAWRAEVEREGHHQARLGVGTTATSP